jgi:hypothetical protein
MFFYALSRFVVNRLSGILPSLDTLNVVGLIVMAPARLGRTLAKYLQSRSRIHNTSFSFVAYEWAF